MLGNFSCFGCRLPTFFKVIFFQIKFQEHYQLDPDSDGPELGPDCLQGYQLITKVNQDSYFCLVSSDNSTLVFNISS